MVALFRRVRSHAHAVSFIDKEAVKTKTLSKGQQTLHLGALVEVQVNGDSDDDETDPLMMLRLGDDCR